MRKRGSGVTEPPLAGRDHLVIALVCVVFGWALIYTRFSAIIAWFSDLSEYHVMAVMAVAVLCLFSAVRFLTINRHRSDWIYLIVFLAPIILIALYMTWFYIAYVLEIYQRIGRYESRW
jgi:hypothetical protein